MQLARRVGDAIIINGDAGQGWQVNYQTRAREILQGIAEKPVVLPYSALEGAGIVFESIKVDHFTADRREDVPMVVRNKNEVPWQHRRIVGGGEIQADPIDGMYHYVDKNRHMLGETLFSATYERDGVKGEGQFLSAFDYQELRPLYFLCELPERAKTVGEAFEVLKPVPVLKADTIGETYMRQGDLFAVQSGLDTEDLYNMGATFHTIAGGAARTIRHSDSSVINMLVDVVKSFDYTGSRFESSSLIPELQLQNTNHIATIVATLPDGRQFCQGYMLHRPEGRDADHQDRYISDEWFEAHRNTVPFTTGAAHAWNARGMVD
jgi:hypothetical protein